MQNRSSRIFIFLAKITVRKPSSKMTMLIYSQTVFIPLLQGGNKKKNYCSELCFISFFWLVHEHQNGCDEVHLGT